MNRNLLDFSRQPELSLLGHDLRALLDAQGVLPVAEILSGAQADFLAAEMSPPQPGKARDLLAAMLRGTMG